MAIRANTFNTTSTQFFSSFSPFVAPAGTFATSDIKKMIFVNYIIPTQPVRINQTFGAETVLNFTVIIRNVTINVPLEIEISHSNLFNISGSKLFNLPSRGTANIQVTGNNLVINAQVQSLIQAHFKISAKNLSNEVAYISTDLASAPQTRFSNQIVIQ